MSPKGNGEAVDNGGADLEFRVCRGRPCWVPLSRAGADFVRLLDKECITQRQVLQDLGGAYTHGWVRDVRGWCDTPGIVYRHYRPGTGRWTAYLVACRRCAGCLRSRQGDWASRAGLECVAAERTWLVTFTLGPEARQEQRGAGVDPMESGPAHDAVTRFFDALRHSHGVRYVCVQEAHADGAPHWHALLHESRRRIRWREIKRLWSLGFIHAKLVNEHEHGYAAAYVAKYLTKAQGKRVRASRAYGMGLRGLIARKREAEADRTRVAGREVVA